MYDFIRGTTHYRYTSGQRDFTYLSTQLYVGIVGLERSEINESGDPEQEALTIKAPKDFPVAELFRGTPTSEKLGLILRRIHIGETEAEPIWIGTVQNVKRPNDAVELVCESIMATMYTRGLRLSWQKNCPHVVFDLECRAPKEPFRVPAVLTDVNPILAKAAAFADKPDGWFAGGFLEWNVDGGIERRSISGHAGDTVLLMGTSYGLQAGMEVDAFPGCDQTTGEGGCSKFDNILNYGGIPGLPSRSPMDGKTVF
ncbi:MAG: phage BR0599 family protein [Luteimonas sp.]